MTSGHRLGYERPSETKLGRCVTIRVAGCLKNLKESGGQSGPEPLFDNLTGGYSLVLHVGGMSVGGVTAILIHVAPPSCVPVVEHVEISAVEAASQAATPPTAVVQRQVTAVAHRGRMSEAQPPHRAPALDPAGLGALTDEALIELCLARGDRDERPFRELFRRHRNGVWRACYGYMRNRDDAEDMTQDVFFKAFRSLHQFQGRSAFKTWLYRIAINTCQNEIRRRSRRPQESGMTMDTMAETLTDRETPESYWSDRAPFDHLAQAFMMLRPEERKVLQLKDLDERPYNEVAEMMEISLSAAKMRVQRARLALRSTYSQLTLLEKTD